MDLGKLPLFRMMSQRMDWLNERQKVLAQNVANADTPGFRASDLEPLDFKGALGRLEPVAVARTSPLHLAAASRGAPAHDVAKAKPYETRLDGNAVDLEEQMVKLAQTQSDYQLMTSLYKKHVGLIKTALGRNG